MHDDESVGVAELGGSRVLEQSVDERVESLPVDARPADQRPATRSVGHGTSCRLGRQGHEVGHPAHATR